MVLIWASLALGLCGVSLARPGEGKRGKGGKGGKEERALCHLVCVCCVVLCLLWFAIFFVFPGAFLRLADSRVRVEKIRAAKPCAKHKARKPPQNSTTSHTTAAMEALMHKQVITWILEYACAHDLDELTERLSPSPPTNQKKEKRPSFSVFLP